MNNEEDGLGLALGLDENDAPFEEEEDKGEDEEEEKEKKQMDMQEGMEDQDKFKCTLLSREVIYYMRVVVMKLLQHFQDIHEKLLHQPDFLQWIRKQEETPEFKKIIKLKQDMLGQHHSPEVLIAKKKQMKMATQQFVGKIVPSLQELTLGTIFNAGEFIMRYDRPFPAIKLRQTANSWTSLEMQKRKKNGMIPVRGPAPPPPPPPPPSSSSASASAVLADDDLTLELERELAAKSRTSVPLFLLPSPQQQQKPVSFSPPDTHNYGHKDHKDHKHSKPTATPSYLTVAQKQQVVEDVRKQKVLEEEEQQQKRLEQTKKRRRQELEPEEDFRQTRVFAHELAKRKEVTLQTPLPPEEQHQPPLHNYLDIEAQADEDD